MALASVVVLACGDRENAARDLSLLEDAGGHVARHAGKNVTHVVCVSERDSKSFRASHCKKTAPNAAIVSWKWLTDSVASQKPLNPDLYPVETTVLEDDSTVEDTPVSKPATVVEGDGTQELDSLAILAATAGASKRGQSETKSAPTATGQSSLLSFFGKAGKASPKSASTRKRPAAAVKEGGDAKRSRTDKVLGKWFWKGDNDWVPFHESHNADLEAAYSHLKSNAEVSDGDHKVPIDEERFVDVMQMAQMRFDDHRKTRPVRRDEIPAASNLRVKAKHNHHDHDRGLHTDLVPSWYWMADRGWQPFAEDVAEILEGKHKDIASNPSGVEETTVQVDRERFVDLSDTSRMAQRRYDDPKKSRPVQRVLVTPEHAAEERANGGAVIWSRSDPADENVFRPYSAGQIELIEAAYIRRKTAVDVNDLQINFDDMVERGHGGDSRMRYIRRTGPPPMWRAGDGTVEGTWATSATPQSDFANASTLVDTSFEPTDEFEEVDLSSEQDDEPQHSTSLSIRAHQSQFFGDSPALGTHSSPSDVSNDESDTEPDEIDSLNHKGHQQHQPEHRRVVLVKDIPTWDPTTQGEDFDFENLLPSAYGPNATLNAKISLFQGDITGLECAGIQNAAKPSLLGGGGIDGAIHSAAGPGLLRECQRLNGCDVGSTVITSGHRLPARHVLHTVGPLGENPVLLRNCYLSTLNLCRQHGVKTIALCCVSTGIYGYPLGRAAHIAVQTVRDWLECSTENFDSLDRVIFVMYLEKELSVYRKVLPRYFP